MTDAQSDRRSNRVWSYEMDDLSDGHPEKLNMDAEYTSTSTSSKSSSDLPSTPRTQSVAVIKQPRSGYKHCWGSWVHWTRLPEGIRWLLVVSSFVIVICVTGWFGGSYLAAQNRIEKERLAKLDAGNALHRRASVMTLPSESSVIPLSTAAPSTSVTAPIYVFTDPARNTFLTKVRAATSTNGVVSPTPSMGVTRKDLNRIVTLNLVLDQLM
ncbi:hypothetical protein N7516_003849 [Penicillium verrucosum]|uniref:uncharacterized protein n=1 Tax=Penicillium verrucosum TaxID=60171 RepID=UPI0025451B2C|nr:uncharacterized protein N7516_003849 [Penicillium verrucosum]KAJ5943681.1 hypothetical protein N7516_003849 [Penicillium verrucosum]